MNDAVRVALAARVFTLAALSSVAALSGPAYVPGALGVAAVVAVATLASLLPTRRSAGTGPRPLCLVALGEGVAVAVLAGVVHPYDSTVTPYLVIPALIAALDAGRRGVGVVVGVEFAALVAATAAAGQTWDRGTVTSALTWLLTSVGVGLMGLAARRPADSGADGPYRSAVGLIRRLDALSDRLSGGLDPVAIAEQVLALVETHAPTRAAALLVRNGADASVAPLRFSTGTPAGGVPWAEDLAVRCWTQASPVVDDRRLALPLTAGGEVVAVLVLEAVAPVTGHVVLGLREALPGFALQLQAALLFARVREAATSQERQRIAREVHDGVAQDVASLGYLVDNLAAGTTDPEQARQLALLRGELTRVVTDLRHSIFDLRHEVGAGTGLGESLSAYAHQVGSTSSLRVHVTLDEEGPRLPRDVERELLRIAQEAMSNARKHAEAQNLWLRCTVRSPYAEVEVLDDGTRPHAPRPDSQGLAIMRERARSIDAELHVEEPTGEGTGTRVRVEVGSRPDDLDPRPRLRPVTDLREAG